jgi:DNA helicase-2/ATP-dependent DNA helicase PcrA
MSYEAELQGEREHLQGVRTHIGRQIEAGTAGLKLTDDFTEQVLNALRQKELDQLNKSKARPFFAKVDFQERDQPDREQAYIGRFGLFDRATMVPIVLDWRSPMANLYYAHSFQTVPVDIKLGNRLLFDITKKRQFEMERGDITQFYDMSRESGANRLLLERLQQRGEQKLKDIVETIQAEQNIILRAETNQALIVQGAAGSGKTTIALHRLAFLAYSYRDRGSFDNFLIIAPNRLFIDYISDVLPDLGIDGVVQTTWEEALIPYIPLPKGYAFADSSVKTASFLEREDAAADENLRITLLASKLRGSMAMKRLLDTYIERRIQATIPETDLVLSKAHRMSAEDIRRKFHVDFRHYPYMQRRKRLLQALKQWKEDCATEARRTLETRIQPGQYAATEKRVAEVRELYDRKLAEYVETVKSVEIVSFYRNVFSKLENITSLLAETVMHGIDKQTGDAEQLTAYFSERREPGNKTKLEWDDIAPLFYLSYQFYGLGKTRAFSHIIVDEAQDFAPFQMHALSVLSTSGSMTILGDLAQSIYPYRGLTDWGDLQGGVFPGAVSIERLKKSYRSTVEIMTAANQVLSHWDNPHITKAEPVLRHGEAPIAVRLLDEATASKTIAERIEALREAGMANIAVIDKTVVRCRDLQQRLSIAGVSDAHLIADKASRYEGGVSVLPVYLSKGMEFDAVLLVNPTKDAYNPATPEDIKLLYVAFTRSLHRLEVYHWDDLSPLLAAAFGK